MWCFLSQSSENMVIKEVLSAPRSPWQNPFIVRVIGLIRRECRDHVIVLNEAHLKTFFARISNIIIMTEHI